MTSPEFEERDYYRGASGWVYGIDGYPRVRALNEFSAMGYDLVESEVIDGYLYDRFKLR